MKTLSVSTLDGGTNNMYEVDHDGELIVLGRKKLWQNAEPEYDINAIKIHVMFEGGVEKIFRSIALSDETIASIYKDVDNYIIEGYKK